MSITPIEVISMAPKSQAVTPIKHQDVQKPVNDQQQLNQQFNQEIKHNSQQTVRTIKSENNEFRYDAKEKGSNSYNDSKKKEKKESNNKDNKKNPPFRSGSIDIKI